jgi:hypothetical protein
MTNVVYILGAGRSGSTLLERLLGSAPDAAALGEMHSLWRLPLERLTCSCGAPGPDCGFWEEVRARAGLGETGLRSLAEIENESIRHVRIAATGFSLRRFHADMLVARFAAMQRDLLEAAAEVAGVSWIIDSSKAAPRAWVLAGLADTSIIHLTRARSAVAASWAAGKADPSLGGPMERVSASLAASDQARAALSAALLSCQADVRRLRHEALLAAPQSAIERLRLRALTARVAWSGPDRFTPDPQYHSLNGNPDRFSRGEIIIRSPVHFESPLP